MNEIFWKLVERADEIGGDDPDIRDEVFAELLIQEIIQIVHRETDDSVRVETAIQKYFGVEE